MLGFPFISLKGWDDVFVTGFGWMAQMLEVPFVGGLTFEVHPLCEPVALLRRRLRSPVGPNAELRIAKPARSFVLRQRFPRALKGSFGDFERGRLGRARFPDEGARSQCGQCGSARDGHIRARLYIFSSKKDNVNFNEIYCVFAGKGRACKASRMAGFSRRSLSEISFSLFALASSPRRK
jgi:hypothetical protein